MYNQEIIHKEFDKIRENLKNLSGPDHLTILAMSLVAALVEFFDEDHYEEILSKLNKTVLMQSLSAIEILKKTRSNKHETL